MTTEFALTQLKTIGSNLRGGNSYMNGYASSILKYVNFLEKELSELVKSDNNGGDWFNAYQDVDSYLFKALLSKGLEFPIVDEKHPQLNTIAAIELLIENGI